MPSSDVEVVIVGGGSAGIAAAQRLRQARVPCVLVEARTRLGGRAWSVVDRSGYPLDVGCGWLHSADRNPWVAIAVAQGRAIDKTRPPWGRPSPSPAFPISEQHAFFAASNAFHERVDAVLNQPDRAASALLEPGNRWNALIGAVNTYVSGGELEHVSAHDLARYDDTGTNWRVVEGYGTTVAAYGAGVDVMLDCPVTRIDHGSKRLRVETARGAIAADRAIVTVPSDVLAGENIVFAPALPDKIEAAGALPLGLADKLFLSLERAQEFAQEIRMFGRTDRAGTGNYHFRPFGRPLIEAYFGGRLASQLEAGGERAFFDFARSELVGLLGSAFAGRIAPLHVHLWERDPFARGSYSYARPGMADRRAALAAPVDGRLFFAGEACEPREFSTAHGAWISGVAAAEQALAAQRR
jgi:monoamine oxidase